MNAQVAANRDQNLANLATQSANVPAQQMQMLQQERQHDLQAYQAQANVSLQAQQLAQQRAAAGRSGGSGGNGGSNDNSWMFKYLNDEDKKLYEQHNIGALYDWDEDAKQFVAKPSAKKFLEFAGQPEVLTKDSKDEKVQTAYRYAAAYRTSLMDQVKEQPK